MNYMYVSWYLGILYMIMMKKQVQTFLPKYRNMIQEPTNPVLLFPGLGASRLLLKGKDIYPPTLNEYALHYQHWKKMMTEERKLETYPLGDRRALDLCIPYFHNNVNYYTKLVQDPQVYTIPYDFRQLDNEPYLTNFYDILRKYIESFPRPVHFLCHSSGGLVAHWFLHRQSEAWRKQWIDTVTHVNVPFGGVVTVLEHCVRDDTVMNRYLGRGVFSAMGATIWNLPDTRYLHHPVVTYNGETVKDYFDFFQIKDLYRRYQENQPIIDSFKSPTGSQTYIMYATTCPPNQTLEQLAVVSSSWTTKKKTSSWNIQSVYGPGDKVVSLSSLLVPQVWKDPNTHFFPMPDMEHSNIFR
uniref:Uncharacterized protein n=1 Tax=viral metagenome TaxID=1070528 RepID=A0A6C0HUN3_9ZZZZ